MKKEGVLICRIIHFAGQFGKTPLWGCLPKICLMEEVLSLELFKLYNILYAKIEVGPKRNVITILKNTNCLKNANQTI